MWDYLSKICFTRHRPSSPAPHLVIRLDETRPTGTLKPTGGFEPLVEREEDTDMCTNAVKTAGDLMAAIEPTIKSLLTETGLINTPEAQTALTEYDAALAAVQGWVSGTPAQETIEAIGIFETAFNALPIPALYKTLADLVLAGITTVIGVLTANSPAPTAPAEATAAPEDVQTAHVVSTIADTTEKVQTLVPGFKRSIWHSAASQYKTAWDNAVDQGGFPQTLKV
jgi:hypothetical protein